MIPAASPHGVYISQLTNISEFTLPISISVMGSYFPLSCLITGYLSIVTRHMPLVESFES